MVNIKTVPWSRGSSGDGDAAGARKHCIIFSHSLLLLGEREREPTRKKVWRFSVFCSSISDFLLSSFSEIPKIAHTWAANVRKLEGGGTGQHSGVFWTPSLLQIQSNHLVGLKTKDRSNPSHWIFTNIFFLVKLSFFPSKFKPFKP